MEKTILVTGGAGYIGSHVVVQLLKAGFTVSVIDNLSNSVIEAVDRVRELVGLDLSRRLDFNLGDLTKMADLEKLFSKTRFDAVIHLAGLKGERVSERTPLRYYYNNLIGTPNLFKVMAKYHCKKMVFSSSATLYGEPIAPCVDTFELKPMHPYGETKLFLEEIACDIQRTEPDWRIILLRYFNPVAAHESGKIGEYPKEVPNNIMNNIHLAAVGKLPHLNLYGYGAEADSSTTDNTAVRDFTHVMDLAEGHVAALVKLLDKDTGCCVAYNLGTGRGTSMIELVSAYEKASEKKIPYNVCLREPGGHSKSVCASTEKAEKELGWKAKYGVEEMCRDHWNWVSQNPSGYQPRRELQ